MKKLVGFVGCLCLVLLVGCSGSGEGQDDAAVEEDALTDIGDAANGDTGIDLRNDSKEPGGDEVAEPPLDALPEEGSESGSDPGGADGGDGSSETGSDLVQDSGVDQAPDGAADVDQSCPPVSSSGPWEIAVVDCSPKYKSRVAIDIGPDQTAHLAYNNYTSDDGYHTPEVWYAQKIGDTFSLERAAPAEGRSNEFANLVVDSAGKPFVFFNRYILDQDQIDIFYVTKNEGVFTQRTQLTSTTTADEYAPAVAIDAQDTVHVLFQERSGEPPNFVYSVGYAQLSAGTPTPVEKVATDTAPFGLSPGYDLAVESDGTVHAVYSRPGTLNSLLSVLYYRKRTSSGWQEERQVCTTADDCKNKSEATDVWFPAVAVDGEGTVHLIYVQGPNMDEKTLVYQYLAADTFETEKAISGSIDDRSYYLGLAAESDGTLHVAFTRFYLNQEDQYKEDVFYLSRKNSAWSSEARITDTPFAGEFATAIAVDSNGVPQVAFVESAENFPDGMVYLATPQ